MTDPVKAITGLIRRRCGALAELALEQGDSDPWHSLLFDGGRHHIMLRLSGDRIDEALAAMRDEIGAPEFAIPGHLIADIRMTAIDHGAGDALVTLDALTIAN